MKKVDELTPAEFTLPPLHQAARQRDVEKAQSLVAAGADVNELDAKEANGDGGNSPLWYAAQGIPRGGIAVAQILVRAGAEVNSAGEFAMTPLHMACSWGHADMVRFLHEQGADLELKDDYGRTAVDLARLDYEEGREMLKENQPEGFAAWLEGMEAINHYFDNLAS